MRYFSPLTSINVPFPTHGGHLHMTPRISNTLPPGFLSAPDSCMMDEPSNPNLASTSAAAADIKEHEVGGDAKVWVTLNDSFQQVQSVLDRNRVLIQQVNQNHRSRLPDNMAKNVALIQEINANISKIVSLYSDLSTNFSSVFRLGNKLHVDNGNGDSNGQA